MGPFRVYGALNFFVAGSSVFIIFLSLYLVFFVSLFLICVTFLDIKSSILLLIVCHSFIHEMDIFHFML